MTLALLLGLHLFLPSARPYTAKFLDLSYCGTPRWYHSLGIGDAAAGRCGKGIDDAYFVLTGILLFTMLRAFMMSFVYTPIGRSQGITKPKALMRFAEQAWGFTFALTSWSCGMILFYRSPYWLDMDAFYANYP
ncbi:MAG: hypothetical protein EOO77_21040, partial [Oxalobacteraceae bacterium]